jgi:DNA transformation protein and related proteins
VVRSSPKLTPLRVSGEVRDFVIDQLSGLRGLRARAMFGGVGLYAGDVFFGIVAADVLYFKVDDSTRAVYEAEGCKPFTPYGDRAASMQYYAVPLEVLESAPTLVEWARRAVAGARATGPKPKAQSRKPISARRPATRR